MIPLFDLNSTEGRLLGNVITFGVKNTPKHTKWYSPYLLMAVSVKSEWIFVNVPFWDTLPFARCLPLQAHFFGWRLSPSYSHLWKHVSPRGLSTCHLYNSRTFMVIRNYLQSQDS